jgi:hypothetical protein
MIPKEVTATTLNNAFQKKSMFLLVSTLVKWEQNLKTIISKRHLKVSHSECTCQIFSPNRSDFRLLNKLSQLTYVYCLNNNFSITTRHWNAYGHYQAIEINQHFFFQRHYQLTKGPQRKQIVATICVDCVNDKLLLVCTQVCMWLH